MPPGRSFGGPVGLTINPQQYKSIRKRFDTLKKFAGEKEYLRIMEHHAKNTVGRIKQDAPVDTGRLRREVSYEMAVNGVHLRSRAIDPDTGEDYAYVQNYGDSARNIPATYYWSKNIPLMIQRIHRDISRRLKEAIGF